MKAHTTRKAKPMTPNIKSASAAARSPVSFCTVLLVWLWMSIGAISALADNILIADQFNNRVIEADPAGNIVWQFGLGPNDFSAKSIIGVNDAQRVGRYTLMAGTATPPGVIPQAPNGPADNRVILVDPSAKIICQYCM